MKPIPQHFQKSRNYSRGIIINFVALRQELETAKLFPVKICTKSIICLVPASIVVRLFYVGCILAVEALPVETKSDNDASDNLYIYNSGFVRE